MSIDWNTVLLVYSVGIILYIAIRLSLIPSHDILGRQLSPVYRVIISRGILWPIVVLILTIAAIIIFFKKIFNKDTYKRR